MRVSIYTQVVGWYPAYPSALMLRYSQLTSVLLTRLTLGLPDLLRLRIVTSEQTSSSRTL